MKTAIKFVTGSKKAPGAAMEKERVVNTGTRAVREMDLTDTIVRGMVSNTGIAGKEYQTKHEEFRLKN